MIHSQKVTARRAARNAAAPLQSPSARTVTPLPAVVWEPILRAALVEDLGRAGDLTTDAVVLGDAAAQGRIVARKTGVAAGLHMSLATFALLDARVSGHAAVADGTKVAAGETLAELAGPARALLTGERTALNLLGHLCGIATATRTLVDAIDGTRASIACTRKTTPGLRALEKYAVRAGGGMNHRFGLDDGVLVKDNHLVAAGGIGPAVARVRAHVGHMVKIQVEVDTLDQLDELIPLGVDAVLLDNMSPATMAEAVGRIDGRMLAEASGNITGENVRPVAESGVDIVSVGWITHSAPRLDVALDFDA